MKRLIVLLVVLCSFISTTKASHVLGGEIGWKCLTTGKYRFFMSVYRDCSGATWPYNNETIQIEGAPLPKNANGTPFSTIIMKPDSTRWKNERQGDTSPTCTDEYGYQLSCANGDNGVVQQFFYLSDPITMQGVPARRGWKFYFPSPICCRPGGIENVNTGAAGDMLLRAIMYPTKNRDNVDPCIDSSPEFRSLPTTIICRSQEFTYNSTAIDNDLDSLIYGWDRPYNEPVAAPLALTYKPGFSPTNPTPDKTFDIRNIPSTLDPISGIIKVAVYSGTGVEKYITVIRVDSYRDGVQIASVFREIPVSIYPCPRLISGQVNNPPKVLISGKPSEGVVVDVTAGQEVRIPIQAIDLDITGYGSQLQTVTMVPDGLLFSRNRQTPTPCQVTNGRGGNISVEPCAYLKDQTPFLDTQDDPPVYKIQGLGGLATEFVWQTDCKHVQTQTGVPGTNEGIYNFVLRISDDHCPVPGLNYPTVTVRVKDPKPLPEPIMKGIDVGLDGQVTYQWVPPLDSAFTFEKYIVQAVAPLDGVNPNWLPGALNPNLKVYRSKQKNSIYPVYSPQTNILQKIPNRDWYFRMTTVSGCTDDVESDPSTPARIIEPEAVPSGTGLDPLRSVATITWNRPKPSNSKTYPYFHYESNTHYYIWENDSVSNGEVAEAGNWYLRGDTSATTYDVGTAICGDYAAFRIEARDTVITWLQGSAPNLRLDSLDTLVFSTFSTIDTLFMVDRGFIPKPKLDTIEVKANGDVYFRVDRANAGTAGTYKIYANSVSPANLLTTFRAKDQDSVLIPGQGADGAIKSYVVQALDECNPSVVAKSYVYETILPDGSLTNSCPPIYTLNWQKPTGFATPLKGYRIFVDIGRTGNFKQVGSVGANTTTTDIPVLGDTTYAFKVIAFDNEDAINISAEKVASIADLRSKEIPDPPNLRCTFVEDNGEVTLSFLPPGVDSTNNGNGYKFQYRKGNGSWQDFAGSGNVYYDAYKDDGDQGDTSVRITGINAQTARYDFRGVVLGDCDGKGYNAWSNEISSIFIEATAVPNDVDKKGDIQWNSTQVDYGASLYSLFKDTFDLRYTPKILNLAVDSVAYLDNGNRGICFGAQNYYVTIEDEFSKCISRSNIDSALYQDNFPPPPLHLNFITYDRSSNNLVAHWTRDINSDTDSLFFTTTDGVNSGLQAYKAIGKEDYIVEQYEIPFTTLDARDSAVVVGAIAQDGCGNRSAEEDLTFHKSMDVEVIWNVCDSSMQITWNPYEGFNEDFDLTYEVWFDSTTTGGTNFAPIAGNQLLSDTTFNHKIEVGDKVYRYYVVASSSDPAAAGFESASNVDSDLAIYEDEPRYGYLTFATVEDKVVNLEYYKDTLITVKGYNIYRGTDKLFMNKVGFVDYQTVKDDKIFDFTDANVDVSSYSYFYKVQVLNACDEPVDTSNFGRSILLNVDPDNEAITNTLRWNEYVEWDSTVAYYNVYRGIDALPTKNVYEVVPPSKKGENLFVDDVYGDLFSIGKFCYQVEAVQGQVTDKATNGFPNDLDPARSNSNVVCVTQKPLFYVPNAFAPDGVNKTFGPKGQFFDFSLYEMVIFNRWGEEVFRTRDLNKGWDGTFNGKEAQLGSYVYTIRFIDADGDEHRRKGSVTLIR